MSQIRTWYIGAVAAALVLVLAGWFLLISPKKAEAESLREQATTQEQANQQLRAQIDTLKAASTGVPVQDAGVAAIAVKIPANPALPTLIRTLNSLSASTDVEIESVAPATPSTIVVEPPTLTGVAVGASNVATNELQFITVEITGQGSYYGVERFIKGLEDNPRAVLVTGINISDKATGAAAATSTTDLRSMKLTVRVFRTAPLPPTPAPSAPAATK